MSVQRKEAHRKMHNDNDAEQRRMQRSRLRLPAKPLVSQPRRLMSLAKDAHAPKPPRPHALLRLLRLQEEKEEKRRGRRERQGTLVLLAYYFACAVVVVIVIVLAITSIFGTLANNITSPPASCCLPLGAAPVIGALVLHRFYASVLQFPFDTLSRSGDSGLDDTLCRHMTYIYVSISSFIVYFRVRKVS